MSYPDRPYLRWSYTNGFGERVERENPRDFEDAARYLYAQYRRYLDYPKDGAAVFDLEYAAPQIFSKIAANISRIRDETGEMRHAKWLELIREGEFGFKDEVNYAAKGAGSWKQEALDTLDDVAQTGPDSAIPAPFQNSDWKLFHDALQAHRFYVLHELLPSYGLLPGNRRWLSGLLRIFSAMVGLWPTR